MLQGDTLQYYWPSLSYHFIIKIFFDLFLIGGLRQVLLYIFKADFLSRARGLIFGLSLLLHPYFVYAQQPMLWWVCPFGQASLSLCCWTKPKYLNPMCLLKLIIKLAKQMNHKNLLSTGHIAQSVTCLIADPGVPSLIPAQSYTFAEIDHEIISMVILLPSADSRRLVVSYKGKCVHKVLANR